MKYYKDDDGKVYLLQRCPFCGMSVAEIWKQSDAYEGKVDPERYTIVCSFYEGGCGATCGFHDTINDAVKRWNVRVVI